MKLIKKAKALQTIMAGLKQDAKIGLVPTMGALHEGHLSLIKKCVNENEISVVSIFVNPVQFGPNEDYLKYPRPLAKDLKLCGQAGVDYVFAPSVEDMFDKNYKTFIEVYGLQNMLCGKTRKTHFRGVATVVAKLFNISCADNAYFGLKDFQQVKVIEAMKKDLNFYTKIIPCPLVREPDGLALSSRNIYLSPNERKEALKISTALMEARKDFKTKPADEVLKRAKKILQSIKGGRIDYIELLNYNDLSPIDEKTKRAVMLAAVWVGKTRLIDNMELTRRTK
jgi:pantoate--beta-alanine ligase